MSQTDGKMTMGQLLDMASRQCVRIKGRSGKIRNPSDVRASLSAANLARPVYVCEDTVYDSPNGETCGPNIVCELTTLRAPAPAAEVA